MANVSPYFHMTRRLTRAKNAIVNSETHAKLFGGNLGENESKGDISGIEQNSTKTKQFKDVRTKRHISPVYEDDDNVKKSKWEPQDWEQQLKNIYEMRKDRDAPVDSMGCDRISDTSAQPNVISIIEQPHMLITVHILGPPPPITYSIGSIP